MCVPLNGDLHQGDVQTAMILIGDVQSVCCTALAILGMVPLAVGGGTQGKGV